MKFFDELTTDTKIIIICGIMLVILIVVLLF